MQAVTKQAGCKPGGFPAMAAVPGLAGQQVQSTPRCVHCQCKLPTPVSWVAITPLSSIHTRLHSRGGVLVHNHTQLPPHMPE